MGRSVVLKLALALLACSGWGCSGAPKATPLGFLGRLRNPRSHEAVARSNPFESRPNRAHAAASDQEEFESGSDFAAKDDAPAASGHDPATQRLIEQELQDATPEERTRLLQDLRGLQPAMVQQILRSRRLVNQMAQEQAARLESAIEQTGGEQPAPDAAPPRRDAGLGAADPWGGRGPADRPLGGGHSFEAAASRTATDGALIQPGDWESGRATLAAPGVSANQNPRVPGHSVPSFGHPGAVATPDGPLPPPAGLLDAPAATGAAAGPNLAGIEPVPAPGVQPADLPRTAAAARPVSPPGGDLPPLPGAGPRAPGAGPNDDLQRLIGLTEAQVAPLRLSERPTEAERLAYIRQHVHLRVLYLVAGQQERALTAIPGIDAADQEFWQQTFWAVANYFDADAMPDRGDRAAQTIAQMRQAVRRLQETARLEIRNAAFCYKIEKFGNYERFERDEFSPGQPVLLYAEVENFKCEPTVDGQFRSLLRPSIEIYKAGPAGDLVDRMEFSPVEDLCRECRRDYFHSYELTLPQKLSLGPHVLKLTVEDQLSRKVATYTLNFTVK